MTQPRARTWLKALSSSPCHLWDTIMDDLPGKSIHPAVADQIVPRCTARSRGIRESTARASSKRRGSSIAKSKDHSWTTYCKVPTKQWQSLLRNALGFRTIPVPKDRSCSTTVGVYCSTPKPMWCIIMSSTGASTIRLNTRIAVTTWREIRHTQTTTQSGSQRSMSRKRILLLDYAFFMPQSWLVCPFCTVCTSQDAWGTEIKRANIRPASSVYSKAGWRSHWKSLLIRGLGGLVRMME